jgi:DNA-binding MarR family transcriptional regulator
MDDAPASAQALSAVTGVRLRRLQALFARHWSLAFRARGVELSSVQGGLLLLIRDNPGLPQIAFARLLDVEPPTLAQSLAPLVNAGLVHRDRATRDRRAMALRLSRQGLAVAAQIAEGQPLHEARLLAGLSTQERRTLLDLLDRAIASAEGAMAEAAAPSREIENSVGGAANAATGVLQEG